MNEDKEWGQMVDTYVVEGPVEKITCKLIVKAMQKMKSRKATGQLEVSVR